MFLKNLWLHRLDILIKDSNMTSNENIQLITISKCNEYKIYDVSGIKEHLKMAIKFPQ